LPLGLPYAVARGDPEAPLRSGGSLARSLASLVSAAGRFKDSF